MTSLQRRVRHAARQNLGVLTGRRAPSTRVSALARRVRAENLTYLSWDKLRSLELAIREATQDAVAGDFIEAGVALGGSAVIMASLRPPGSSFYGYDVFGLIPEPGTDDSEDAHERYATISAGDSRGLGGDGYYGYRTDLMGDVAAALARHGTPVTPGAVELRQGLFDDTLHPEGPVSLAHIDCDWHDPVLTCLRRIYPHLSPGGQLILDDYNDYRGCAKAAHAFLAEVEDVLIVRAQPHLVLRRS